MHRKQTISSTHEMYLKVLYSVRSRHEVARVTDMARGLGVSPGTVSGVLKKLEALNLVEHDRYGVVALTDTGTAIAECVVRRFETLQAVLIEMFGVDPATAAEDACMMEHAVSPLTANRMAAALARHREMAESNPTEPASVSGLCKVCESEGECQAVSLAFDAAEKDG